MEEKQLESSVSDVINQMQNKIGELECWQDVMKCKSFVTQARKEKYIKMGVYEKVEKELHEICAKKIQSIVSLGELREKDKADIVSTSFTLEEIGILKKIAHRVLSQDQKPDPRIHDITTLKPQTASFTEPPRNTSIPEVQDDGFDMDADTSGMEPGQKLAYLKEKKRRQKMIRDREELVSGTNTTTPLNSSLVVGSLQTLAGTSSLRFEGGKMNSPPPFSKVKILAVDGALARISFEDPSYSGSNAVVNVNELVGFEYVE